MLTHITTTLYDLLEALQAVVAPDEDGLVVATVMGLVRSGRLTWLAPESSAALSERNQQASA